MIIRVDKKDIVTRVRVVTGDVIAAYDTTGTLTHKYQAKAKSPPTQSHLVSVMDTGNVIDKLTASVAPTWPNFLAVQQLYKKLLKLIGATITNPGITQERNRGGSLHDAVCKTLKNLVWQDNGQFPDLKEQLLEIKLQTSSTIDLGLVCPNSTEPIDDLPMFRHCDVRYAIFYAARKERHAALACPLQKSPRQEGESWH